MCPAGLGRMLNDCLWDLSIVGAGTYKKEKRSQKSNGGK